MQINYVILIMQSWLTNNANYVGGNIMTNGKSTLEKIYSFFGFWKYYQYIGGKRVKTFYWCCFPWRFIRKFDLFSIPDRQ